MKTIHFTSGSRKEINFEDALCVFDDLGIEVVFGAKMCTLRVEAERVEDVCRGLETAGIKVGRDFYLS